MDVITLALAKKYAREKISEAETLGWRKQVVDALPTSDQDAHTIYLVRNGNMFDEYIWDADSNDWISLGTVGVSGDKYYIHTQTVASTSVTINHMLNKNPSVSAVDENDQLVVGDVEYIDSNNLIVSFNSAFSGKVYLN